MVLLVAVMLCTVASRTACATTQLPPSGRPADTGAAPRHGGDGQSAMTFDEFLDRLMMAESGGRDHLRNPLSTAVGPFQLLSGLMLELARKHFREETAHLSVPEILALRTDRAIARRAAAAFTQDNAAHLAREGLPTTFQNLRLAYFAGPAGATRILRADPGARIATLLSPAAMRANPFLRGMTAADLIAKSARDIAADAHATAGIKPPAGAKSKSGELPFQVRCDRGLPSCQKWIALRMAKYRRQQARAENSSR